MHKLGISFLIIMAGLVAKQVYSQPDVPKFTWTVSADKSSLKKGEIITLTFKSTVPENWYVYSSNILCKIGPIKPSLTIFDSGVVEKIGKLVSMGDVKEMDEVFDCQIGKFTKTVILKQQFKVLNADSAIKLKLEVQICSKINGMCSQVTKDFSVTLEKKASDDSRRLHLNKASNGELKPKDTQIQGVMKHEPTLNRLISN